MCEEPPKKAGVCIGFHEDEESGIYFFFFAWGKSLMVGGKGGVLYMRIT